MVDPIYLTGAWLNPDTAIRFGSNERYQAVDENQDGGNDSCYTVKAIPSNFVLHEPLLTA